MDSGRWTRRLLEAVGDSGGISAEPGPVWSECGTAEAAEPGGWLAPAGPNGGLTHDAISSGTGNPVCPKFDCWCFTEVAAIQMVTTC